MLRSAVASLLLLLPGAALAQTPAPAPAEPIAQPAPQAEPAQPVAQPTFPPAPQAAPAVPPQPEAPPVVPAETAVPADPKKSEQGHDLSFDGRVRMGVKLESIELGVNDDTSREK